MAQLVARLTGSQEDTGSSPVGSKVINGGLLFMKKSLIILISIFILIFVSCGGEAIFAGRAHRLKAEKALKEIRNALARYSIKNGHYPTAEGWERVLEPYFRKEIHPDPEWITRRKKFVMTADNKITQCEGVTKEIKKNLFFADSSLKEGVTKYLYPIDSALTYSSYEIKEARAYDYRNIVPELNGLMDFISNIDIEVEKSKAISSMVQQKEEISLLMTQIENGLFMVDFNPDIPLMFACGPFVINVSARCARMDERTVGKRFCRNRREPMIADGVSVSQPVNHRQRLRPVTPHDVSWSSRNFLIRVGLLVLVDSRCVVKGESSH